MSAPSIPNLLSLRSRGGRGRGRGRGRGGSEPGSKAAASHDSIIQGTDTDAAVSRLSAVDLGYLSDPYARYFVSALGGPPARRFPIINRGPCLTERRLPSTYHHSLLLDSLGQQVVRLLALFLLFSASVWKDDMAAQRLTSTAGTYTRTTAIDTLVHSFLEGAQGEGQREGVTKQIVSLGAGTDTRPFRLFSQQGHPQLIYHEIDFPVTSAKKLQTVEAVPPLGSILTNRSVGDSGVDWSGQPPNGQYFCHGLDIRRLSPTSTENLLGLRTDVPTLVLSECCLCYLSQEESDGVLAYFSSRIPNIAAVIYEPIHLGDPFSETMISNLAARNIHMPSLDRRRDEGDEAARLKRLGYETTRQLTIERLWSKWVNEEEKERVDRLEGLDEVEEWQLLAGHYVVVWSFRGDGFEGWRGLG